MMDQMNYMVLGIVVGWLLTQFLTRTIGTRYIKEADFKKFKAEHDSQCSRCQNRRDLALIRRMVVELAIKAGVDPHDIAKVVETRHGSNS